MSPKRYTNAEIAASLRDLTTRMHEVADKMAAAEQCTPELVTKMGELRGAADIAREWAGVIEEGEQ
ncbi:MAG: hypothetical protein ACLFVU_02035 [Phycisphaerae bacterium]